MLFTKFYCIIWVEYQGGRLKRLFLIIFCLLIYLSYTQTSIENLQERLTESTGRDRIVILNQIAKKLQRESPLSSIEYSKQAILLCDQINNKSNKLIALNNIADVYYFQSEYDSARVYYESALEISRELKSKSSEARAFNDLGIVAEENEDYIKALENYTNALDIYQYLNDKEEIANTLNNIGIIFEDLNDYGKSLEYHLQSLRIYEEMGNVIGISISLNNIGNIYHNLGKYELALKYYEESIIIDLELKDKQGISTSYINLGNTYSSMQEYDKAFDYYDKALEIDMEMGDMEGQASGYNNIGIIYHELKEYDKALDYYQRSLAISRSLEDSWAIANTLNNQAELYYNQQKYNESLTYLDQALQVAEKKGTQDIMLESYRIAAAVYKDIGNYREAFKYYEEYSNLKEVIILESIDKIYSLQHQYETEKKEKEIQILQREKKYNNFVRNSLIIGIFFTILIGFILFYLLSNKKKENDIRKQTEKKLLESESRFRTLAEKIQTAIYTIDKFGRFKYANPAAFEMTGYSEKELSSLKFIDIVHPEFKEIVKERSFSRLNGKNPISNYGFKIITKQGKEKWLELSNGLINVNGETLILGTAVDVTDKRIAEKNLIKSEEKYRTLQENLHVGIFRCTPDGIFISINPALMKMFKFKKMSDVLNTPIHELYFDPLERNIILDKLSRKGEILNQELVFKKNDGSIFWCNFNIKAVYDRDGNWIYQDGIIQDIDEHKKIQNVKELIYNINSIFMRTPNLHDAFAMIRVYLNRIMDATNFYVAFYDKESGLISAPYYKDEKKDHVPKPQPLGTGLTSYIIKSGKSLYLDSRRRDVLIKKKDIPEWNWQSKLWMGVPLKISKNYFGVMAIQSYHDENAYTREDLKLLETIADQISSVLVRKKQEDALKASENFSRAIINSSPLGISARDKFGTLIIANEAWKKLWEKTEQDIEQDKKKRKKFELNQRDSYLGEYKEKVKEIYKKGGELYIPDLRLEQKKNGKVIWITQYFYAIMDENDKVNKIVIMTEDITQRKLNEDKIRASLKEKDMLLKEVYHRVKNNMQVVSSLLRLQSYQIKDEEDRAYFKDSHNRVKTMSLIHEKLYLSDNLERIDFKGYVISLTTHLYSSYSISPADVKLQVNVKDINLDINKAIPCGLLINELVSNAIKHGYTIGKKGTIVVELKSQAGYKFLSVKNDGLPFPPDVDFKNSETLGLRLIQALTEQLHGNLTLNRKNGTEITIKFKI